MLTFTLQGICQAGQWQRLGEDVLCGLHVYQPVRVVLEKQTLVQNVALQTISQICKCRLLSGRTLKPFKPQSTHLSLITTGNQYAVATKGFLCIEVRDHTCHFLSFWPQMPECVHIP